METADSGRQTFRKPERLVSRLAFERLMKQGESLHQFPVRAVWKSFQLPTPYPIQVAFSVPKRNFRRAVDRNRIKRLMREAYRKNKNLLYTLLKGTGKQYAVMFVFTGKKLPSFQEIERLVSSTLENIAKSVQKTAE